jgi:hypothetical protein
VTDFIEEFGARIEAAREVASVREREGLQRRAEIVRATNDLYRHGEQRFRDLAADLVTAPITHICSIGVTRPTLGALP